MPPVLYIVIGAIAVPLLAAFTRWVQLGRQARRAAAMGNEGERFNTGGNIRDLTIRGRNAICSVL